MTESKEMKRVLVFGGKTGWIGGMMCDLIKKEGASNVGKNCLGIAHGHSRTGHGERVDVCIHEKSPNPLFAFGL